MKKFSFPLEKVLQYKVSLLQEEKNRLSMLRAELARTEGEIAENTQQLLDSDAQLKNLAAKGTNICTLRSLQFKIDNTRRLLEGLELVRNKQAALVETQLAVVLEANRSVSGIERLKDKQMEIYHEAQQKEEALIIGELVSTKYTLSGRS